MMITWTKQLIDDTIEYCLATRGNPCVCSGCPVADKKDPEWDVSQGGCPIANDVCTANGICLDNDPDPTDKIACCYPAWWVDREHKNIEEYRQNVYRDLMDPVEHIIKQVQEAENEEDSTS